LNQAKKPIEFRALPRGDEKKAKASKATVEAVEPAPKRSFQISPQTRNTLVVGGAIALAFFVLLSGPKENMGAHSAPHAASEIGTEESRVNRYLIDADMKHRMQMQKSELDNLASTKPIPQGARIERPDTRTLGVNLNGENAAEKVYEDLYGKQVSATPVSPEDRIEFKIAQKKWISEEERQERKQFVQNFIKQAYDAGWAIDLDENLVVVRVKPITNHPLMPLDQVLDKISKQGY
jgi:hypothetical protein